MKYLYIDNTGESHGCFHTAIVEAIKNNGVFCEELADVFKLTKCPEGSAASWVLDWF